MRKTDQFFKLSLALLFGLSMLWTSCSDDEGADPGPPPGDTTVADTTILYFMGLEAGTNPATDVLSAAESLEAGTVSPVNNGFQQPAWMSFLQGHNQIIVGGYTSSPEFVSYALDENGELVKGENFFLNEDTYAYDFVDETTALMVASPRAGFGDKTIYTINTEEMAIAGTVKTNFGDIKEDSLLAFPNDMKVVGDKLFISYYHIHARGDFTTPASDMARVAVFSYPGLKFEKEITDDRAPNIGRYYTTNALEIAENGDIYTFSPSALACGYAPTPSKNSAILRIKNGETEFDKDFYIDFETLSGGYKIQDLFYMGNGKAVVRVLQEDETNPLYTWASYRPTSDVPLLSTGIVDLNAQTFTLLPDVPMAGGGWNAAHLKEDGLLYLGVSNSAYAGVYIIDAENGTATQGATVDGNYSKGIFSLMHISAE